MTRPTNQEMFKWANDPPEWQYLGFASSQEELDDLREFSIGERRKFLINSCLSEMALRNGLDTVEVADKEALDFETIPLKPVLSLWGCRHMAELHTVSVGDSWPYGGNYTRADAHMYWRKLAADYATVNGHTILTSKYSTLVYDRPKSYDWNPKVPPVSKDDHFEAAYHEARGLIEIGFDIRFHMDGITRIESACLDLESVERSLVRWRNASHAEREWLYGPDPVAFWEAILEETRRYDVERPRSYVDVVETMAEGVYLAPYIDEEVIKSGDFVNIDDFYKVTVELGGSLQAASTGFTKVVRALAPNYRFNDSYGVQRVLPDGAIFFEKRLLPHAKESVGEFGRNKAVIAAIDSLMGVEERMERFTDEEYHRIVFGE